MEFADVQYSDKAPTLSEFGKYFLSFDEYMAERISEVLGRDALTKTEGTKGGQLHEFFKGAAELLKRFYRRSGGKISNTAVEAWIRQLSVNNRLKELQKNLPPAASMLSSETHVVKMGLDKINKALSPPNASRGKPYSIPSKADPDYNQAIAEDVAGVNRWIRWALTLTQIEKLNPDVPGVARYVEAVRKWWSDKGNARLGEMSKMGKEEALAFAHFAQAVTIESDVLGRKLNLAELDALATKWKVTSRAREIWVGTQEDFKLAFDKLHQVLIADARRQFRHLDPIQRRIEVDKAVAKLNEEFSNMQNRDYWPLSRFGQYWVQMKAGKDVANYEGKAFKTGETMLFEMYETESDQKARHASLQKAFGHHEAGKGKLVEDQYQWSGMPPSLIERIRQIMVDETASDPALTQAERQARQEASDARQTDFDKFMHELAPGQSYKHRLQRRKGTPGYSMDVQRGYANHFMHFANHISRVENYAELMEAMSDVRRHRIEREHAGADSANSLGDLESYLRRHYSYAMNPGNEWATLRAFGFTWYIGFVPRSAFVNFTQVPLLTYPSLAARFGDVEAVAEITKAMKDIRKTLIRGPGIEPDLAAALDRGVEAMILNESIATELAGTSEGSNLARMLPEGAKGGEAGRFIRQMSGSAAWMFQKAEMMNRFITFT
ncbi:MAG: PLxRFG domain-containing protein, partial [Planctomycetota bacterium]